MTKTTATQAQIVRGLMRSKWWAATSRVDPKRAGSAYISRRSTSGTCPASTSRMMPPPTAVMPPTRMAASGSTPAPSALSEPPMAKVARPAASSTRTNLEIRSTPGWKRKVTRPATSGRPHEPPVGDADRRRVADEHVAHDAAAEGRGGGQHQHPEQVEALLDRDQSTGQREDENTDQVKGQLEVRVEGQHRRPNLPSRRGHFAVATRGGRVSPQCGEYGRGQCGTCD